MFNPEDFQEYYEQTAPIYVLDTIDWRYENYLCELNLEAEVETLNPQPWQMVSSVSDRDRCESRFSSLADAILWAQYQNNLPHSCFTDYSDPLEPQYWNPDYQEYNSWDQGMKDIGLYFITEVVRIRKINPDSGDYKGVVVMTKDDIPEFIGCYRPLPLPTTEPTRFDNLDEISRIEEAWWIERHGASDDPNMFN